MIFLDANIFMYAAGTEHPHKSPCLDLLELIASGKAEACVDAEILQEILHRYRSLGRWGEGRQVYNAARSLVPTVIPITDEIVDEARDLLDSHPRIMARDALHVAAFRQSGARALYSYDRDFDSVRGVRRVEPPMRDLR